MGIVEVERRRRGRDERGVLLVVWDEMILVLMEARLRALCFGWTLSGEFIVLDGGVKTAGRSSMDRYCLDSSFRLHLSVQCFCFLLFAVCSQGNRGLTLAFTSSLLHPTLSKTIREGGPE